MDFKMYFREKKYDLQDVYDFFDEFHRTVEKQEKRIKELEQDKDELILLLDIEKRRNSEFEKN